MMGKIRNLKYQLLKRSFYSAHLTHSYIILFRKLVKNWTGESLGLKKEMMTAIGEYFVDLPE